LTLFYGFALALGLALALPSIKKKKQTEKPTLNCWQKVKKRTKPA